MSIGLFIRMLFAGAVIAAAGCASPGALQQTPLSQDDLDAFLASGRDARSYGITIYQDAAGPRFEFANRVHQDRAARMDFVSPRNLPVPVIRAKTATAVNLNLLLDSSARQNWLLMASVKAMDYRSFEPPMGEYADHIVSEIPGYAGIANKIILDELHIESPVFYVAPARGGLGPIARAEELTGDEPLLQARRALGARTQAVMGAALMRSFASIRFDFPQRTVRFSTHATYKPPVPSAVVANLPLRDWRGRPAVEGTFAGKPLWLVIDTAGDFELSLPDGPSETTGTLVLGDLTIDEVRADSAADLGLPEDFPARLGRRLLGRYIITLDHKNQRVWFEYPSLPEADKSATTMDDEPTAPVQYRGIKR